MDRELKLMNSVYIVVTVFISTLMLIGGAYVNSLPESFFM